jgi:hypothetical protein
MEVDRDAQCLDPLPEFPHRLLVEVTRLVRVSDVGAAIHQRTFEAEVLDGAFEFVCRARRVLERNGRLDWHTAPNGSR